MPRHRQERRLTNRTHRGRRSKQRRFTPALAKCGGGCETLEARTLLSVAPWDASYKELNTFSAPIDREFVAGEVVVALQWQAPTDAEPWNADDSPQKSLPTSLIPAPLQNSSLLFSTKRGDTALTYVRVELPPDLDVAQAITAWSDLPAVAWVAPNYVYTSDPRDLVPNDPLYASQYHHPLMQNNLAWDITQGTASVIIAVTDDGVATHPDLNPNIWTNPGEIAGNAIDDDGNGFIDDVHGWDFSSNDNDPAPVGSDTHGTHVAGIAAAETGNALGVAGTAGDTTIMPIRFYGSNAWTSTVIAQSYAYAVDNGAQIVSTSYNVDGFVGDPIFEAALDYLYDNGVLHLNSAGNNNELNPARAVYGQSLYVANTNSLDQKDGSSNYGVGIDLSAPGASILSTVAGGGYASFSGTSMATPNAAGVAALIWSLHPTWNRDQVAAQLLGTTDNIDAVNPTYAGLLGSGRANSLRALSESLAAPQIEDVVELPIEGGTLHEVPSMLTVQLGNVLDTSTVNNPGNWILRGDGADDTFGTPDDVFVSLVLETDYKIGTNQLVFDLGAMPYDRYEFRAVAAGIADPFGTPLDGNADSVGGDDYVRTFTLAPAPIDWQRALPEGGFVFYYHDTTAVETSPISYPTELLGGQKLSASVQPLNLSATVTITLFQGNSPLTSVSSPAPGTAAILANFLLPSDSNYSLEIVSDTLTDISFDAFLNAEIELEGTGNSLVGPVLLPGLPAAQSIDASSFALGSDRLAVVGDSDSPDDEDYYAFHLLAGQSASLVVFAGGTATAITTETEPNDDGVFGVSATDRDLANDWSGSFVSTGGNNYEATLTGTITSGNDADWDVFRIYASPGDTLALTLTGITLGDTYLRLYDKFGVQIAFNDDFFGLDSFISYSSFAYAGEYYVVADSFGSSSGSYSLEAVFATTNPINPASAVAATLALYNSAGTLVAVGVPGPDGLGRYIANYVAPTDGDYVARVVVAPANVQHQLVVTRDASFDTPANESIETAQQITPSGTVLGAYFGPIAITSESEPNDDGLVGITVNDRNAANDLTASFQSIGGNNYRAIVTGNIATGNDVDWDFFRVRAVPGDSYTVALDGITLGDAYLRLYNRDGVLLAQDDDGGSGLNSLIVFSSFTYAGEYYLVADSFSSSAGTYQLTATRTTAEAPFTSELDFYRVQVVAGDVLHLYASLPNVGSSELGNTIEPILELFDPTGVLVATDDEINHLAALSGAYVVRVRAAAGQGEYVLHVEGATGTDPAPHVVASDPADGGSLSVFPALLTLDWSDSLDLSTLDAADFLITPPSGPAFIADSVTVIDGNTIAFALPAAANVGDGSYAVSIGAGVLADLQQQPNAAYNATFHIDSIPPTVIASSVLHLGTYDAGLSQFVFDFGDDLDESVLSPDDFVLWQLTNLGPIEFFATTFDYDSSLRRLTIDTTPLGEGNYRLWLLSGAEYLRDPSGNPLDGEINLATTVPSGNGVPGGHFIVNFSVDITTPVPVEVSTVKLPLGAMVYDPPFIGNIGASGDVDTLSIEMDPGQRITVLVESLEEDLDLAVTLRDPGSAVIAGADLGGPGAFELIQSAGLTTSGSYTIEIAGLGTPGDYRVTILLNADYELESLDGTSNDTPADAQPLDGAFTPLAGNASRAAVLGVAQDVLLLYEDEPFATNVLSPDWSTYSSNAGGRIQLTGSHGTAGGPFAVIMDTTSNTATLNELIGVIDLSGLSHPVLSFYHAVYGDESTAFPAGAFVDHAFADGIAISDDGVTWHGIWNAPVQSFGVWQQYSVDLLAAADAAGIALGPNFRIKFQQMDDFALTTDGRGYDELIVFDRLPESDWYRVDVGAGESITLAIEGDSSDRAQVELYLGSSLLAVGQQGATNVDAAISNFVAPFGGTYHVRVSAPPESTYTLVVVRNGHFGLEPNGVAELAQDISHSDGVLGYVFTPESPVSTGSLAPESVPTTPADNPIPLLIDFPGPKDSRFIPPDPTLAAGPEQIVTLVNTQIAINAKSGELLFQQDLSGPSGFFGSVGATTSVFDPWVVFDFDSQRFFIVAIDIASNTQSNMFIAVSHDATPTGSADWYKYKLDFTDFTAGLGSGAHFPDYPKAAVDQDALWISANYFPIASGSGVYGGITAIAKSSLLSGGVANIVYEERFTNFSVFPVQTYGDAGRQYFAEANFSSGNSLIIHAVSNVLTSPTRQTFTLPVPAYQSAFDVPQLGSSSVADGLDARLITGVWRDGSMWIAHGIRDPSIGDNEAVVRWYEISTNNYPSGGSPTLVQSGNVDPGVGIHAWMPAIAVDGAGSMALGFALGGPNMHYAAGYTGRLASDVVGFTMPVSLLHAGEAVYTGFRWGDYTGLAIDPADDATFWVFNEYATAQPGFGWATQIGAFQLVAPLDTDWYSFAAQAGDELELSTLTPADGPGEFVNLLDVQIELYDPAGNLVAADDNSGPGTNAALNHVALQSGIYRVRVLAAPGTQGEYFLHVLGATADDPRPTVTDTDPDDGLILNAFPTTYTLDFSEGILDVSVDAGDLFIGGLPALSVTRIDGDTYEFEINPLVNIGDGTYSVVLADSQLSDLQFSGNLSFVGSFTVDTTGPRVIGTEWNDAPLPADAIFSEGPLVFEVFFDELLDTTSSPRRGLLAPGISDVVVVEQVSGTVITPLSVTFDTSTASIQVQLPSLGEGNYLVRLLSGDGGFEDLVGNDLDGEPLGAAPDGTPSGDGIAGGDFVIAFHVDQVDGGTEPFERLRPFASLAFASFNNSGLIDSPGDLDGYSFAAEAGERITAIVTPSDPDAILTIELVGLGATVVGSAPGAPVLLPLAHLLVDGVYQIRVGSTAGGGSFDLDIYRNASLETTDTSDGAELAIDDSFYDLGSGRYSVIGSSSPATISTGALVWGVRPATGEIIKIDPATGSVLDAFPAPDALAPGHTLIGLSIAEDGQSLLYVNSHTNPSALYRLDPVSGAVLSVESTGGFTYDGLSYASTVVFAEDFENGLNGFTIDNSFGSGNGLWHLSTGRGLDVGHSPVTSLYYGQNEGPTGGGNFNAGNTEGAVYSPTISLPSGGPLELSFNYLIARENSTIFDVAQVAINTGSGFVSLLSSTTGAIPVSTLGAWVHQTIDLSVYAGMNVVLRFSFDTVDSAVNSAEGWYIDDIVIAKEGTAIDESIFLSHSGSDLHRQNGYSGSETFFWATGVPHGALGGDDGGRQFGFFADGFIHEYDPQTDTDSFLSTITPPAPDIEGMAFSGNSLFVSTASGLLYTLDPDSGNVLSVITVPEGALFGLGAVAGSRQPLAGDLTFTIDTAGTFIDIGGSVFLQPFEEQSPGSLHGLFTGTVNVNLSGGTLDFTGGSIIDAIEKPGPFEPGNLPADAAGQIPLLEAVAALRNVTFDFTSGAITVAPDGSFAVNGISITATAGTFQFILEEPGLINVAGTTVLNEHLGPGSVHLVGDRFELLVPISLDFQLAPGAIMTLNGQLMAYLDAVSQPVEVLLPEIDEYTLDLTGKVGQPIDVILDGQDGVDFSTHTRVDLLDVDGVTVLATATPIPLGVDAQNYDLAILDWIVPANGVYTIRVRTAVTGEYGLVITDPLIFDTELNDVPDDPIDQPLRSLNGVDSAVGYLETAFAPLPNDLTFTIDTAGTFIDIGGSVFLVPLEEQSPGSLHGLFTGTVNVNLTGNTLDFVGGSVIDAIEKPGPFEPGNLPADAAGQIPLLEAVAALRNVKFDFTSGAITVAPDGSFAANGITITATAGTFEFILEDPGFINVVGTTAVNEHAGLASLQFVGNRLELFVPIFVDVQLAPGAIMTLNGQLLAYIDVPKVGDFDDFYEIDVHAGDTIDLGTRTPLDGLAGLNALDPYLEVLDPLGNPVAIDHNSASDGRNALLSVVALTTGTYRVRVGVESGTGEYVLDVDVTAGDVTPPTVVDVLVASTSWTTDFYNYLDTHGLGTGGYSIPVGNGDQLAALPWTNINQIKIVFSEDVQVEKDDLLLTGVNIPTYAIGSSTFSYEASSFTATWTLAAVIGKDKLYIDLAGDGADPVRDLVGNVLDGNWENPTSKTDTSSDTYPSGNGVAGGDFEFRFNVLPGDVQGDGFVNVSDLSQIVVRVSTPNSSINYNPRLDLTGDGAIAVQDLTSVVARIPGMLPPGEPLPGDASPTDALGPEMSMSGFVEDELFSLADDWTDLGAAEALAVVTTNPKSKVVSSSSLASQLALDALFRGLAGRGSSDWQSDEASEVIAARRYQIAKRPAI